MKRVLVGAYDEVSGEIPENYFDLVIANDVIEHMPDHDDFFVSIQRKMISGGRLVASVPNVRHWSILRELVWFKDWRYTDAGILDRTHLRTFTGKSLKRALREHDFAIEKFKGINRMELKTKNLFPYFLRLATLGYYRDILYYQFGLCVRKK
jgi:2-polyprenyl-3-methyl-5-hydroxy-6-metoxy-1,4-benzoquinol methylase